MGFQLKSFPQIVARMAAKISSETAITDFTDGSVILTLLEAAAQEDFAQYVQMLNIIRAYNLDTTEGTDLDARAKEYSLTRIQPASHSGFVTITDTRFAKIASKIYAGLPGPTAGSFVLNIDDASTFPTSGSVYVGRSTVNSEGPLAYSTPPVNNGSYWTITLTSSFTNDHGTDETVVLSQFSDRTISAGVEVEIPANDISAQETFEINQTVILLDGENVISNVLVTALSPGGFKVPANSIISFPNAPFTGASVTNPLPFVNGRDLETDQQLRDRIRDHIQSLSRGTPQAIKTAIIGLIDTTTNSSVVSAIVTPPVTLADGPSRVYIDNGRGLEPSLSPIGLETIISQATGGQHFFQLENFPVVKSSLVSQNVEPFNLVGGETLLFRVGTNEETFVFSALDFLQKGTAKATEVAQAINARAILVEARTITDSTGAHVFLIPVARTNEDMQIDPSSTAQAVLNFSSLDVQTLKLYKNDKLLTKDGLTASVLSAAQPFDLSTITTLTTDGDITVTPGSAIVTKTVAGLYPFLTYVHPGFYVKFATDDSSFYLRVRTVVSDTKLILDAPYSVASVGGIGNLSIWNSPQIEVAPSSNLEQAEVATFSPTDFLTPAQALATEILSRLRSDISLADVELAVNNTKIKFISNVEDSVNSQVQVLGGQAAIAMGFCTAAPMAGTMTWVANSRVVIGTGSAFTNIPVGTWIKANSDSQGAWTKVESIESDTILYLEEGYRGLSHSTVASSKTNFGTASLGANKDYTLNRSNGQIELNVPLAAGDSLTAGSINTRAFQDSLQETFNFFNLGSQSNLIVSIDGGFTSFATTGSTGPFDNFISTDLTDFDPNLFVGFYVECVSGNNIGQSSYVGTYNSNTGAVTLAAPFMNAILVGDKFVLSQVLTFIHASDFVDPKNALASEAVTAINNQILGGKSEVQLNKSVRLRTSNFDLAGEIQIKGGSANTVLGYPLTLATSQLANIANTKSRNSDRAGNPAALGFTIGPHQTLVAILDADPANKTFSMTLEVTGAATAGGIAAFSSSAVGSKYLTSGHFTDFWLYWLTGANAGSLQTVLSYTGGTGAFTLEDVFPAPIGAITSGDTFSLVPRTSTNVARLLNDLNTTTFSIVANSEVTGITGDLLQISTKTPGSAGKVFITGGTANGLALSVTSIPPGSPVNDLSMTSVSGLSAGLYIKLTVDGAVTTASSGPFDNFTDTSMISTFVNVFTGLDIEILTGLNTGFKTTIATYNDLTGAITLTDPASAPISLGDTYRISRPAYVIAITGTSAPYVVTINDPSNTPIDVSAYTPQRTGALRSVNALSLTPLQIEGIDGYKFYTGLIQQTQLTIDGEDRNLNDFPGIAASGTQFEVLSPVLVKLRLIVSVTPNSGVSISSISGDISNAILGYVNSLQVGKTVVLAEIVAAAMGVTGVFDVGITNRASNIIIADNQLARLDASELIVG